MIGAGVVGLAVARALAKQGRDVVVLEATGWIGSEKGGGEGAVFRLSAHCF